jgi:hypothetical protein
VHESRFSSINEDEKKSTGECLCSSFDQSWSNQAFGSRPNASSGHEAMAVHNRLNPEFLLSIICGCMRANIGVAADALSERCVVFVPLSFSLANLFRDVSLLKLCLLLFLLPAVWGVREGARGMRIKLGLAFVLAATVTVLMISAWNSNALWILNWALGWPAWYLVATAQKPSWVKVRTNGGD